MKGCCTLLCIILGFPVRLNAQLPIIADADRDSLGFHTDMQPIKQRTVRAAGMLLLSDLVPWTYDKYVAGANSADVNFRSLGRNLNPGNWNWDDGNFPTNQFAHPYHGSISFNAYRSNGYSFWQSVPAAFIGSYVWETAGESLDFSINDFINTSYGGVIIGEVSHRFADRLVNQRSTGIKRQANEVLAFIINPANGLNRLLDGKWGRLGSRTTQTDTSRIAAEVDIGIRRISGNREINPFRWYGHVKITYGTPYGDLRIPFSFLLIDAEFGKDHSGIINMMSVSGSLTGWKKRKSKNYLSGTMLTANYDYINNEVFSYGGQSIKFNKFAEFAASRKLTLRAAAGAGPVLLAAVPDPYLYHGRAYSYCSGGGFSAAGQLSYKNVFSYGLSYRLGLFKTLSGNSSYHTLHGLTSEISCKYLENLSISIALGSLTLQGRYKHFENINNNYPYLRISTRYSLNNL
jgi:hypothetical protein